MDKKALYPAPYIDPEKHYCVASSTAKGLSMTNYLWQLVEADQ